MGKINKYTEINYQNLKTGDIVVCGGSGPLAYFIRLFTRGFKKRRDKTVSTHTGIIIDFHGQKLILEMLGTTGKIQLNSLERYLESKRRCIIAIKRFIDMDDVDRTLIEKQAAYDIRKSLDYDYRGLVGFVLGKVKDDDKKNYCSELVYRYLKMIGKFFTKKQESKFDVRISPEDIDDLGNLFPIPWTIE